MTVTAHSSTPAPAVVGRHAMGSQVQSYTPWRHLSQYVVLIECNFMRLKQIEQLRIVEMTPK